jgi:predicted GIY-YIG superfamily endonuclease
MTVFHENIMYISWVYFERFNNVQSAIAREKRIKKWNRQWKIRLIEEHNPEWDDLAQGILELEETL